ncbi:Hsp20/alpha crystallin family protein [Rhodosalinus sp. 5P4]|uniref:Hsp20/alpha crystallin family protein n=1 Tax=Rhodosalinus sp. 5P4 TaxID=3239196 RepID=UPI003525C5A4
MPPEGKPAILTPGDIDRIARHSEDRPTMTDMPETAPDAETEEARRSIAARGLAPLWKLRDEIDALFEDIHAGSAFGPLRRRLGAAMPDGAAAHVPPVEMVASDEEVRVTAELPGLHMKDIDVQVSDTTLTISGEKREEVDARDGAGELALCERRYGAFCRVIRLPEGVDPDAAKANFANGVLTVRVPRRPEAAAAPRRIEVKPGG